MQEKSDPSEKKEVEKIFPDSGPGRGDEKVETETKNEKETEKEGETETEERTKTGAETGAETETETGAETETETETGAETGAETGTEETEGEKSEEPEKEDIPNFSMKRRLTKSSTNKILTGVCGGIGEYFDIDPTLVRLAFVILAFFNGIVIVIYIIFAVIMPEGNGLEMSRSMNAFKEGKERNGETDQEVKSERMKLLGAVLLIIGIFLFLDRFHVFEMFWWVDKFFWPAVFTAAGAWLLLRNRV